MLRHRRERHGLDDEESVQSQTKSATDQSVEDENAHEEEDMEGGDKSEDESEESGSHENESEESGGDEDESEESGSDEEESDDDDNDEATYYNLWAFLRKSTKDPDMDAKFLDLKEKLDDGEMEDEKLTEQAWRVVRPEVVHMVSEHYTNLLKIWHFAKHDKFHKQIMKTKRKLIEEEDFNPVEAIERAVKTRRYIIQKATGLLDDTPLKDKVPNFQSLESAKEEEDKDGNEDKEEP